MGVACQPWLTLPLASVTKVGGRGEDRTPDLCIANAALSQLSYAPPLSLVTGDDGPSDSDSLDTVNT